MGNKKVVGAVDAARMVRGKKSHGTIGGSRIGGEPSRSPVRVFIEYLRNDLRGQEWRVQALCAKLGDPDMFHSSNAMESRNARKVCIDCPVRQQCLDYALKTQQRFGTYGGTTPTERSRMLGKKVHRPIQEQRLRISDSLMAQGHTLAEIAVRMGITLETLERSRQRARAAERERAS